MASKRIWGWYFFDWASQPYSTLLLTFTFGPYFSELASAKFLSSGMDQAAANAAAQTYWTTGQTITGLLIACLAPILGAVADGSGRRMPWIWGFSALYVVGSWALWFLSPVQPDLFMAMVWFGLGLIGMEFATIFTNSLMPDLTGDADMGKVSGAGSAWGGKRASVGVLGIALSTDEGGGSGFGWGSCGASRLRA